MFETLFSLKGKIKRLPYFIITLILEILASIIVSFFLSEDSIILPLLFVLFLSIIFLILSAKRLRDMGVNPFYVVIFALITFQLGLTYHLELTRIIVTIVSLIFWLTLSLYPSKNNDEEDNENAIENS